MKKRIFAALCALLLVAPLALADLTAPEGTMSIGDGGTYLTASTLVLPDGNLLFAGAEVVAPEGDASRRGFLLEGTGDGQTGYRFATEPGNDSSASILGMLGGDTVLFRTSTYTDEGSEVEYGSLRYTGAENGLENAADTETDTGLTFPEDLRADDPYGRLYVDEAGIFNIISNISQPMPVHIFYDAEMNPVFTVELEDVAGIEPFDVVFVEDGFIIAGAERLEEGGIRAAAYKLDAKGSLAWVYRSETGFGAFRDALAVDGGVLMSGTSWDDTDAQPNVTRLDGNGEVIWSQDYAGLGEGITDAMGLAPLGEGFVTCSAVNTRYAEYVLLYVGGADGGLLGTSRVVGDSEDAFLYTDLVAGPQGEAYVYGAHAPNHEEPDGLRIFYARLAPEMFEAVAK